MSMVIASRPSKARLSTGEVDPFEVIISRDQMHRLESREMRDALRNGDEVFAKLARHPVNSMPTVRVRLAKKGDALGPNMMGIDERLRSLINSDDDRDTGNLLFIQSKEAVEKAKQDLAYHGGDINKMSSQWRTHRMVELMQGLNEDSRAQTGFRGQKLMDEFFQGSLQTQLQEAAKIQGEGSFPHVIKRLAHGETGIYSNLLTRLHMNLEQHPTMRTSAHRDMLEQLFFQIRQVPISASKAKSSFEGDPRDLWRQFQDALNDGNREAGAERARDALERVLKGTAKETTLNSALEVEHAEKLFGLSGLKPGGTYNLGMMSLRDGHGATAVRDFVKNRNNAVDRVVDAFTKQKADVHTTMEALANIGHTGILGAARTGTMADQSASALGAALNVLKDGARGVMKGGKAALPALAVGAGIAAVAGLASTKISSNGHRPEERAGVADSVPGQPVEGSHSNRPRVQMTPAPAQTKTVAVAPMHKNNDVEVQASAPNRAAAAEAVKMSAKLASRGMTHSTVNYLGGARDRMSKLRMQQQLREKLELNDY
jgi:hypothetical protein